MQFFLVCLHKKHFSEEISNIRQHKLIENFASGRGAIPVGLNFYFSVSPIHYSFESDANFQNGLFRLSEALDGSDRIHDASDTPPLGGSWCIGHPVTHKNDP